MDLGALTLETFAGRVGESFAFESMELKLHEAEPVAGSGERSAFSLIFRGPTEPMLAQGIHPLEHAELGRLEIFLVPLGRDASGAQYQAIFA